MKNFRHVALAVLVVLVGSFVSCSDTEDSVTKTLNIELIDSLQASDVIWGKENECFGVVNAIEEVAEFIHDQSVLPDIDFTKKSLVIAYGRCPQSVDDVYVEVEGSKDAVSVAITVSLGDLTMITPWMLVFTCDKIGSDIHVCHKVNMIW